MKQCSLSVFDKNEYFKKKIYTGSFKVKIGKKAKKITGFTDNAPLKLTLRIYINNDHFE